MTTRLNPYLSFSSNAGEAMEFYKAALGGELRVNTFGEYGGSVTMPLEKQMWGDEFGMFVDKFGVPWMVNITQPQG